MVACVPFSSLSVTRSRARDLKQDPAAHFIWMQIAAVGQDHDTEFSAGHHGNIGRCIVETAVLLDDGWLITEGSFPRERLQIALADVHDAPLCQCHRLMQS